MALFRSIVFVAAAAALAGCCSVGGGCYVAEPGIPTAWDGAGLRPSDAIVPGEGAPRRTVMPRIARPKTEVTVGPIEDVSAAAKSPSEQEWTQRQAADRNADAILTRQLMICRNCTSSAE